MYLGSKADKSVATEMEFAEILTPIEAIRNASAQKKAAALPPYMLVSTSTTNILQRTYLRCPVINNEQGVPEKLPVQYLGAVGPNNTKQHHDNEDDWNHEQLNIWTVGFFGVPGKIIPVKVRRYIDKLMEDTHMFTPKCTGLIEKCSPVNCNMNDF